MDKEVFKNGINFKCQGSSNCCVSRGSYGYVYLSKKDLSRISKFFKISNKKFIQQYCDYTNGFLHLKEKNKNGNCQFLFKKKCSIYKDRPTQCRTWPFWGENMNVKTWNKEIINFCPGIGQGRKISFLNIYKKIKDDYRNEKKILFKKN